MASLGNLNSHEWIKNGCNDPVLSMLELRFLVSIEVNHRSPLLNGNIKQAFCNSILHPTYQHIIRKSAGFTNSKPNT